MQVGINNHTFDVVIDLNNVKWLPVPKAISKRFSSAVIEQLASAILSNVQESLQFKGTFDIESRTENIDEYVHFHFSVTPEEQMLLLQLALREENVDALSVA